MDGVTGPAHAAAALLGEQGEYEDPSGGEREVWGPEDT